VCILSQEDGCFSKPGEIDLSTGFQACIICESLLGETVTYNRPQSFGRDVPPVVSRFSGQRNKTPVSNVNPTWKTSGQVPRLEVWVWSRAAL
jgi:hypothetical protein